MQRFVIRNYGSSRNLPDGHGSYIFIERNGVQGTDDEEMAKLFATYPDIHVAERGNNLSILLPTPPEGPAPQVEPPDEPPDEDEQGEDETEDEQGESEGEDEDATDYEALRVSDLQEIAKDREIPIANLRKPELIEALQKDDAEQKALTEELSAKLTVGQEVRIDEDEEIYLITVLPEQPDGEFTLEPKDPDGNEYGATADQLTLVE